LPCVANRLLVYS